MKTQPEAYLPDLAMSLGNLGARLGEAGRGQEAVEPVKESVSLYRRLVKAQPEAYLPDLAMSLSNLGARRMQVGRVQEAVVPLKESMSLYRRVIKLSPELHRHDLAYTLVVFARAAGQLGQGYRGAALAAVTEAIGLFEPLAAELPALYGQRLREAQSVHSNLVTMPGVPSIDDGPA
ncbi:tetratricopeptide repeat protein [Nocardia asiatica]|uniref:tetratricopeptide repeat protein n=1 Tax=Nocardia asiatica TaxID=209252 RepID=UPI002457D036|nr:tetratricopeptide repeat protein [Nocardia asiatica]